MIVNKEHITEHITCFFKRRVRQLLCVVEELFTVDVNDSDGECIVDDNTIVDENIIVEVQTIVCETSWNQLGHKK